MPLDDIDKCCPGDQVRRYPPAPLPAGAGSPPPSHQREERSPTSETTGEPMLVDPEAGQRTVAEKAQENAPPALAGQEAGPGS